MAKRDTYKYDFKIGNRIRHSGITNDLDRREGEHRSEYRGGRIKQVGRRTSREAAMNWEGRKRKA